MTIYPDNPRKRKVEGIKRPYYKLPADLAPSEVSCVNLEIPTDPEYRELFLTAIWSLTQWYHYERTGTTAGAQVANIFKTAFDSIVFECIEDEDTLSDNWLDLIDGVVTQFQEGGLIKAIGYLINESGEIIVNTALRVIGVTVFGTLAGGLVSIIIGGTVVGEVAVAGGEVVEFLFDTGDTSEKIINLVFDAAA